MGAGNHKKEAENPEVKQEKNIAEPEIQEIQEFVVSSEKTRSERKKAEQASINALAGWSGSQRRAAAVILFAAIAAAYVFAGIRVCRIDATVVCALLVIQVVISVLLDHNPVWLHICVAAVDLIAGFCLDRVLLMVALMVVYVAAVLALEIFQRAGIQEKK